MIEKHYIESFEVNPVPKWLQVRFGQLWDKFGHKGFSLEEASEILDESKDVVTVVISRLRKSGWLSVRLNQEDLRKRTYHLSNPSEIFRYIKNHKVEKNAQNN